MMTSTETYFKINQMSDNIYHIWEPARVASTLIIGATAALLIDTGYGFADLKAVVESLTDLPYQIVNTHCHLDHAGGDYFFDQPVYIHPFERIVYDHYQSVQKPMAIAKYIREQEQKGLPWPEGFDVDAYLTYKDVPFVNLTDGQTFDLGDRRITVIFLPGHTKGSVVLFDDKTGTLFSGDNISDSLWIQFEHSEDVHAYAEHLNRLKSYPIRQIISSHSQKTWPPEMIPLMQEAIKAIRLEESKVFIHPRTGAEGRTFRYPIPEINGKTKMYIVYDHHRFYPF